MTRFPLGPLLALAGVSSPWALGRLAGVEPHVVMLAARQGGLTWETADRVAIGLGFHPALVWDDWELPVTIVERSDLLAAAGRLFAALRAETSP